MRMCALACVMMMHCIEPAARHTHPTTGLPPALATWSLPTCLPALRLQSAGQICIICVEPSTGRRRPRALLMLHQ